MISIYLEHDKSWSLLQHLELAASRSILQQLQLFLFHRAEIARREFHQGRRSSSVCHVVHSILAIVFGQQFTKLQHSFSNSGWAQIEVEMVYLEASQPCVRTGCCHSMPFHVCPLARSFVRSLLPPSFPPLFVRSFVLVCLFVCLLVCCSYFSIFQ